MEFKVNPKVQIGHIHLTVSDIERSLKFYRDLLGFEITTYYGDSAVFLSAGGYHHHLGLRPSNKRQNQDSIGLVWYTIELPNTSTVQELVNRLQASGVDVTQNGNGYHFHDHANNGIRLYSPD